MRSKRDRLNVLLVKLIVFLPSILSIDDFCLSIKDKSFCYFHVRKANYSATWDDAYESCKSNGSSLPSIDSPEFQKSFIMHLQKQNEISDIWLAGREQNASQWQWPNGQILNNEEIVQSGSLTYQTQAAITKVDIRHPRCKFDVCFKSQWPSNNNKYICQYLDASEICKNFSANGRATFLSGRCFAVQNEEINLFEAIKKCFEDGGDLATLADFEDDVQKYTRLRDRLVSDHNYWIGLRTKWWIWKSIDSAVEMKYSEWNTLPTKQNEECVSIGRSSDYRWKQRVCNDSLQFLCQKVISPSAEEQMTPFSSSSSSDVFPAWAYIGSAIGVFVIVAIATGVTLLVWMRNKRLRMNVAKEYYYDRRTQQKSYEQQWQDVNTKTKGLSLVEVSQGFEIYDEIRDKEDKTTTGRKTASKQQRPYSEIQLVDDVLYMGTNKAK